MKKGKKLLALLLMTVMSLTLGGAFETFKVKAKDFEAGNLYLAVVPVGNGEKYEVPEDLNSLEWENADSNGFIGMPGQTNYTFVLAIADEQGKLSIIPSAGDEAVLPVIYNIQPQWDDDWNVTGWEKTDDGSQLNRYTYGGNDENGEWTELVADGVYDWFFMFGDFLISYEDIDLYVHVDELVPNVYEIDNDGNIETRLYNSEVSYSENGGTYYVGRHIGAYEYSNEDNLEGEALTQAVKQEIKNNASIEVDESDEYTIDDDLTVVTQAGSDDDYYVLRKITINEGHVGDFDINCAVGDNSEEGDPYQASFRFVSAIEGLVIDYANVDEDSQEVSRNWEPTKTFINSQMYQRLPVFIGITPENNDSSDEDSSNDLLPADIGDLTVKKISGGAEVDVSEGEVTFTPITFENEEGEEKSFDGYYWMYASADGEYVLSTAAGSRVIINVELPRYGIYTAPEASAENYAARDGEIIYGSDNNEFYVIWLMGEEEDADWSELPINDDLYLLSEYNDDKNIKKLTIKDTTFEEFNIYDIKFRAVIEGLMIAENFWDVNIENPIDSINSMDKVVDWETKGRGVVYFGYYESDGESETVTPVEIGDIKITAAEGGDKNAVVIKEYTEWQDADSEENGTGGGEVHVLGAYWLSVTKSGTYYLEYKGSKIKVNSDLSVIGLYSDGEAELSDDILIGPAGDNLTYDDSKDNTYYIRLRNGDEVQRVQLSIEGLDSNLLTWSNEEKMGTIAIPKNTLEDITLKADIYYVSEENEDGEWEGYTREFQLKPDVNGLVISWGDVDNPDVLEKDIDEFRRRWDEAEVKNEVWLTLAVVSKDANGSKKIEAVPADDIENIKIYDESGENEIAKSVAEIYDSNMGDVYTERNVLDGIFVFYFNKSGTYTIKYEKDGVSESCVLVVNTPVLSFHKTLGETDEADIVGNEYYNSEYEITEGDKNFYINILDDNEEKDDEGNVISKETFKILDVNLLAAEGKTEADYANFNYEISDNKKSVTLSINNKQYAPVDLDVIFERKHYSLDDNGVLAEDWAEVWSDSPYERQPYQRFSIDVHLGLYSDGAPQQGFAGMYVSKQWFEDPSIAWSDGSIERPMYWVHADSIQAVIDKLASAAKVGEVVGVASEGDGEVPLEVVNTGYISVNLSGYGDEEIPPQYIASSGNLKGIIVNGSGVASPYFLRHDDVLKRIDPTIEDDSSIHVCNAEGYIKMFNENAKKPSDVKALDQDVVTKLQGIKAPEYGVVSVGNNLYRATRKEKTYYNRDKKKNVTLYSYSITEEDLTPIAEIDDKQADYLWQEGDPEGIQCVMELPGVHANLYCDMKFIGDMGKLTIGYPDKSLASNDGEYFNAEISYDTGKDDDGRVLTENIKIKDPDEYKEGKDINLRYSTKEGNELDTATTYKLTTYKIESEKKVEGSLDGVDVVVPEPNSLTELTYEQKDAIEAGETLTVSMTADEVQADSADEVTQEGITAIQNEIASDKDNEYGRIDFIDLSVKAAVGDEETQITETAVPMTVTIPIPKGYKKGTKFRIARYHKGKNGMPEVFFFDLVEKLLNDVGINIGYVMDETKGTITFLTDRFSTYALMEVGEDSRTTVDLSKASWNYKEAFTADGTTKKVEITGLPEGVKVTYLDNEAKEVGKYLAKAVVSLSDDKSYKLPETIPDGLTSLSWEIKAAPVNPSDSPKTPTDTQKTTVTDTPAAQQTDTSTTPSPFEVGATVKDTSGNGAASTSTFTVTDKSTGAGVKGKATYSGESSATATVVIPDTITGEDGVVYEVTKIADNALKGNTTVKEVTIGNNIVEIGTGAFQKATKLTTVKLGTNVTTIGKSAFSECTKLKKVTASGSKITTVGESAFKGDKVLASIDLSKSKIKTIGKDAFNGDKKLKTIKINGNALKKVGKNAFKNIKKNAIITIYAKDKKTYNKVIKLIKKSGAKNVKYKFKKKK